MTRNSGSSHSSNGHRRRLRMVVIASTLCLGPAILSACSQALSTAHLDAYRNGPGPRQITVRYLVGAGDPDGKAEVLKQTATDVTIRVQYTHNDEPNVSKAVAKEVVIDLAEPIDGRTVRDESGVVVPAMTSTG